MAEMKYWLPGMPIIAPGKLDTAEPTYRIDNAKQADIKAWKAYWLDRPATEVWGEEAMRLIVKYRLSPLRASRVMTYLHVAMQDAYTRAGKAKLQKTGESASTNAAAAVMLDHFFPLETPGRIEALGASSLAALAASQPKQLNSIAAGAGIGRGVARLAILHALNDGADEVWDPRAKPSTKPGMWRATPPLSSAYPQEPLAGEWQTWVLKDGAEIQPPAPPRYNSEVLLQAAREVLDVGRDLTPAQKKIADDWHLDQGIATPPGIWNLKARELANKRKLAEKDRLKLLATLNVAMQDAAIACWHAKYTWWVQRPVTVIQDKLDKSFTPYLLTPTHPSYVSAHATVSGAAAEILKRFFPKDVRQIDAWAEEAAMSRLYGGIHYRFDNEAGLALGRRIGKTVLERTLSQGKNKK